MIRPIFIFTFSLLLPFAAFAQVTVQTKAKQAIVIDYDTGAILFEKNAQEKMPTSSMSKVITMYVVFDALKNDVISLNDTFTVSEKAWRKGGSKMFVELNKRIKIEDLIRGVVVQSGNDATIVLAEGLKGSEGAFATALNDKAKELGMTNSNFMNASGWPDPDHYSTAQDLAILAKALITDFPNYYKYFSEKEFTYHNITQQNRNPLLYKNIGADGVKTGHTEDGGYGLIGSGMQNGRRVIIVLNGLGDEKERAEESGRLLEWGLQRFENDKIFAANDNVETAEVVLGKSGQVPLMVKDDVIVTLPRGNEKPLSASVHYKGPLVAPIKAGQEVAVLTLETPYGKPQNIPLYAAQDVKKKGFFGTALTRARYLLTGNG